MDEELTEITLFTICTPYKTHKWDVTNGLVNYNSEMISPDNVLCMFINDPTNLKVLRSDICKRLPIRNGIYSYMWVELKRFL